MTRSSATYVFLFAIVLAAQSYPAVGAGLSGAGIGSGGDVLCIRGLQNDSIVCAGTSRNGLYRSTDGGAVWVQSNVREGAVYAILPDSRNSSHWYAATSVGLLASVDGGLQWWTVDSVFRPSALAAPPSGPRLLLAADGITVRRTADDGKTWATVDQLLPYHINTLVSTQTDSGSVFFGANDTTILISSEKKSGIWTELPALPRSGTARLHITSLLVDTLSLDGMRLLAGTDAGAYVYQFRLAQWVRCDAGLPSGRIGALGVIVYDATAASRSYSYCAAMGRLPDDPAAQSGVYKLSSSAGIIAPGTRWTKIADEQVDVRACSMPERGPNRAKIYLATGDGVRVSYDDGTTWVRKTLDVFPIASLALTAFNAGIVGSGGTTTTTVRISNRGERTLTVGSILLNTSKNFSFITPYDSLAIPAQQTAEIAVRFVPTGVGKFTALLSFSTNDPQLARGEAVLTGFCTGLGTTGGRTIVIDRTHAGTDAASPMYSDLARAFTLAGMSVIDTLPASPAAAVAMVILPAPNRPFTSGECTVLAGLAAAGTTIAALGSAADRSAAVLNALFSMPQWNDAAQMEVSVRFRADTASLASGFIAAAKSFSASSASYLAHADTLVFASGTGLTLTGKNSDTLFAAAGLSFSSAAPGTQSAAILASVTRAGKGKIIAFGDPRFWANSAPGDMATGLWAADNFACAFSIAGTVENAAVSLSGTLQNEQYRLISVPYVLADNSTASVLSGLGKPNPYDWRLFGLWNDKAQSYAEYPSPPLMTVDRGKAYWLIMKDERPLQLGTADYTVLPEPFTMTLKPGFTLIGDPFPFAINWWKSVRPASVDMWAWEYDGKGFSPTNILRPFEGYFVNNASDSDAVVTMVPVPINLNVMDKAAIASSASAEGEWSMRVSATDGTVSDNENYFGMLQSSSETLDKNDFAEPPVPPGRYVSLSFIEADRRALAGDYRPIATGGAVWDCTVRASQPCAHISLHIERMSPLPAGYGVYILDRGAERIADCTQASAYECTFETNESSRAFRILVGEQKFIEQHTDGIPMTPLVYGLEQNFPNPWNPSTTIRYTVARSGMVELDVFTVLGQKIKTLVQRQQALGVYAEQWDGKDDSGMEVSSGVYFYRLTTPAYVQSKRMVLVR